MLKSKKFRKRKGLRMFSFNINTLDLKEIEVNGSVVFESNTIYFESLNFKNAERRVRNYFEKNNKQLDNLHYIPLKTERQGSFI